MPSGVLTRDNPPQRDNQYAALESLGGGNPIIQPSLYSPASRTGVAYVVFAAKYSTYHHPL
ncbi:hypothetical protein PABG_04804 [Paracoccidioides brasiliensis Pb03]|nr:hypothetical protein PABG_04804 [Paracoccidioides brasiliensis Pb03]